MLESYFPANCPVKFPFTSPVFHLPLDDAYASPKVYDQIGVFPQIFTDPTGNPNTSTHSVAGHVGNALNFDGVDDCIICTDDAWQPYMAQDADFTVAIWAKANSPSAASNLHFIGNGTGADNGFAFTFRFNQYFLRFNITISGTPYPVFYIVPGTCDSNWHHFAMVRFGYTITLYFDGSPVATATSSIYAAQAYMAGNSLVLGAQNSLATYAPCDLDDFRLYTRALSSAEIALLAT